MGKKVGRNEPCPCGSGQKYKKCCIDARRSPFSIRGLDPAQIPPEALAALSRQQREEAERVRRFGHVRAPITIEHAGHRFVAVGSRLFYGKNWKTFHDFLVSYIATVVGEEWGNAELKKLFDERHPVVQWYDHLCTFQRKHADPGRPGAIYSAAATGPAMAYHSLAYDLYTLEHHALLQTKLVSRLKIKDQFQGARYETYVAASFIRAGFDIELDDEGDRSTTHCEFTATHKTTGSEYSVEAKSRHRPGLLGQPGPAPSVADIEADVATLLVRALRKRADHERIVFIDVHVPPHQGALFEADWFRKAARQVRRLEETLRGNDALPPAFVFFTNSPYDLVDAEAVEPGRSIVFTAINMPDFRKPDDPDADAQISAGAIVKKYPAVMELFDSVTQHSQIPAEL